MAKRRASGEGNIRKRSDGRWEGRYVAGHDANGKPIRKNVLGKTQAEARDKLKHAIEESRLMDVGRADEFTVGAWAKTWFELYSKPNIRESTQERYWNHIRFHIIPYVGQIKLAKLTGRDIQKMYNDVRDHGRIPKGPNDKRDKSLSASYIRSLHRMFHMCLDRAVKEQLIIRNPCNDVVLPKVEKKEIMILKPEHMKDYLAEADRRGVLPIFFLELCSGLRKGELVALLWSNLDVERKTISVSKQAVRVKGGGVKVTTAFVLMASAVASLRMKTDIACFKRRIAPQSLQQAVTIFLLYLGLFAGSTFLISEIDAIPVIDCMVETSSALGTVGLSIGLTEHLSVASQLILIGLMYFGRVGALTMIYTLNNQYRPNRGRLPEEKITVG